MAKAKKLPSGSWRCLAYVGKENEKRIYKSFTAETKNEAEYQANKYLRENKGKTKSKKHYMTLKEAMSKYIDNKTAILSPTTVKEYTRMKNNSFKTLADKSIYKITNDDIQMAINEESKTKAPKTVRNYHGFLASVMSEYTDLNIRTKLPQKTKMDMHILSHDDINRLIKITENTYMEIPILLAAHMGLRRSEICGLTWGDIDFDKSTIRINKAMVYDKENKTVVKQPKTYSSNRTLEAPETVMTALKKYRKDGKEHIFTHKPQIITNRITRLKEQHNFPPFRFHDLRHYFASVMLSLNVPDKYAMDKMGHSTNNVLKNVYQHIMDEKQKEVSKTINNYFEYIHHEKQHENN